MSTSESGSADPEAPNTPGTALTHYNQREAAAAATAADEQSADATATATKDTDLQAEDPDPLSESASAEEKEAHTKLVLEYCDEMYDVLKDSRFKGEAFWLEYTSTFREHTINSMPKKMSQLWVELLTSKGVHVTRKRYFARSKALIECLKEEKFKPALVDLNGELLPQKEKDVGNKTVKSVETSDDMQTNNDNTRIATSGDKASSKKEDDDGDINSATPDRTRTSHGDTTERPLGVNGLMRSYNGRNKFGGECDEDLSSSLLLYDTFARLCQLTDIQKAEALPVMLKDNALAFYTREYRPGNAFEDITRKLYAWHTSDEQKSRMLNRWQTFRLSDAMRDEPDKSEMDVFRKFSSKLAALQKQLDVHYQHDDLLRDQLVIACNITKIQQSLRERVPKTSQDAINRIATFLSSDPKSANAFISEESEDVAMYGLGRQFGGQARGQMKGSTFTRHRGHNHRGQNHRGQNRISSKWIKGVKGCYVCGKDHKAFTRHSREEVKDAIKRLRDSTPSAMVSVEDLAFVCDQLHEENEEESAHAAEVQFSDDDEETDEQASAFYARHAREMDKDTEVQLANASYIHGRSFSADMKHEISAMFSALSMGEESTFQGILIDTCANRQSIMSYDQYRAYCREFNVPMDIKVDTKKSIHGIGGRSDGIGSAIVPIPFKDLDLVVDVRFQIMRNNNPTLLSMRDMVESGLDISIQDKVVKFGCAEQKLAFENYFLIHRWKPDEINFCLYTESELRRLHRRFGHPSAKALYNLIRRANPSEVQPNVEKEIQQLVAECTTCAKTASKPRHFKLTIGTDNLRYNHIVAVDVMYLNGRPVLHLVDEATHFNAAHFLRNMSSQHVWQVILKCWSHAYLGPPDFLHVDQGSNFISKEFKESAHTDGVSILQAPIESPNTMTHVERYHAPLRLAYNRIREGLARSERDDDCLQMAVKCVNDTVGPEGLCPTLLVFGALPRPARVKCAETQLERARAIEAATNAVQKELAQRRLSFAEKHSHGAKGVEASEQLRKLPAGSQVLVYRERTKKWEGPFSFIQVEGETAVVQLPTGRKIFRSTVVKPVVRSVLEEPTVPSTHAEDENDQSCSTHPIPEQVCVALFGSTKVVQARKDQLHLFKSSREKELKGLLENNTFRVVSRSSVPYGQRIYGTRFIDAFKTVDENEILKSRLVAQNYRDAEATSILTKAPTVSRLGQRMTVCLGACYPDHIAYFRDITQAYVQSDTTLERVIYLQPPKEMNLGDEQVLLALKPLYGIPESGLHWFLTYQTHHKKALTMNATTVDPCVLFKNNDGTIEGMVALQVDDAFGYGTKSFIQKENECITRFLSKPQRILKKGESGTFNGFSIQRNENGSYTMLQSKKLKSLKSVDDEESFISVRGQAQYIGCCTRPEISAAVQLLAPGESKPSESQFKSLNKIVAHCKSSEDIGLNYVQLNLDSAHLVLFTDASFANAENNKSQLGFVLLLVDSTKKANIIHFGSSRCKRVTRSVMAAEVHALVHGFDQAFAAKHMLEQVLQREVPIDAYVDSKTLFNVVSKHATTMEKRLQIDIDSLRESHDKGELRRLAWIPSKDNIADALTKPCVWNRHKLWEVMRTNRCDLQSTGWVDISSTRLQQF